ncbi:MAG: hypothetical protein IJL78_04495 [Lachnospiraceae bacterium]|nr:hypothetical protein [Lachnospiraceae bacterium]
MNKSEFQSRLIDNLNARVSPGYSVRVDQIKKNNSVNRPALILHNEKEKDAVISPVVYVDLFYDAYIEGESFNNLADAAWKILQVQAPKALTGVLLDDREYVLSHAVLRLVGRAGNENMLSEFLSREFLDLVVTIGVILLDDEENGDPQAISVMPRALFEKLGITEDELFDRARENSRKYLGASLRNMHDFIGPSARDTGTAMDPAGRELPEIYVLSNRQCYYGAGAILYSDLVRDLAKDLSADLLVVPSSIHELLVMREQGKGHADFVREFVYGINRSELRPEDILSDSVYRYSLAEDRLEIA